MTTYNPDALDALDMEYILGDSGQDYKTTWGRSGRQLNVRCCPFCGNSKWKVYLNADTGLGNCFAGSCSQGTFNKWQFLKELYDLSGKDLQAKIEVMAMMQGWRPKEKSIKFDPGPLNLPPSVPVQELPAMPRYLLDRGIDASLGAYFGLRYCESGTFEVKDPKGKTMRQDYSNRIILPIYNMQGEIVSFQGRDATGKSEKRYLFPPMYASTGSQLYNVQNWREGMDTLVIGEGPFDAIGIQKALNAKGMHKALGVASFGMSFSESSQQDDQINRLLELKRLGLRHVYFMWDNEPAATAAAIKACLKVLRYGLTCHIALLQGAKDPGEATPDQIDQAIKTAQPITSELQAMLLQRKLAH